MQLSRLGLLVSLSLWLAACGGSSTPPPPAFAQANADRTNVTVTQAGTSQLLPPPNSARLQTGDSLQVDEGGRALLRFSDFLTVEVLRQGDLQVRELGLSQQSALAVFGQSGGAFVNELQPGPGGVDRRVTVQSDFAVITATGTRFMVVKEANSPLEWLFGLDAGADDLTVQAKNDPNRSALTAKPVSSGVACQGLSFGVPAQPASRSRAGNSDDSGFMGSPAATAARRGPTLKAAPAGVKPGGSRPAGSAASAATAVPAATGCRGHHHRRHRHLRRRCWQAAADC